MYHTLMSDWLERICGVKPPDIEAVLGAVCWHCGEPAREEGPPLKTCTGCGVGRYCDRDCQRQEWRIHKLLHQEIEHTRNILTRNEQEEIEREQKEQEDI